MLDGTNILKDINSSENRINREDYSTELANQIITRAARDLKMCMKRDIKHNTYSYINSNVRQVLGTSSIAYFFSSPLCSMCCGDIDPWYIVARIAVEMDYPFMEQLEQDYERGLIKPCQIKEHVIGLRSRDTCTGETATTSTDIYTKR